MPDVAL
jgi:hypothetical protein